MSTVRGLADSIGGADDVTDRICAFDECPEPVRTRGWCNLHYRRWLRHGDPSIVLPIPGITWEDSPSWKGDDVGYHGAHCRVRRLRGRASEHPCVFCGDPADDWAYDHLDPHEKYTPEGWPFSPDPDHYIAACKGCHVDFDDV